MTERTAVDIAVRPSAELDSEPADDDVPDDPRDGTAAGPGDLFSGAGPAAGAVELLLGRGALLDRPERRTAMNRGADRALAWREEQAERAERSGVNPAAAEPGHVEHLNVEQRAAGAADSPIDPIWRRLSNALRSRGTGPGPGPIEQAGTTWTRHGSSRRASDPALPGRSFGRTSTSTTVSWSWR